jgi:hypothetical protein
MKGDRMIATAKFTEPKFADGVLELLKRRGFTDMFWQHVAAVRDHFPEIRSMEVHATDDPDIPGRHWVKLALIVPPSQVQSDLFVRHRAAFDEILERFPDRMVIAITLSVEEAAE